MLCENLFCVYWEEDQCLLDEISLSITGSCQECIYVSLDQEILNVRRKQALKRLGDLPEP